MESMSQDQEVNVDSKLVDGRGYYRNKFVFSKSDAHKLMKGIWKDDFASPVKQELTEGKGFKVLDVGCGSGEWTLQLSENYPSSNFIGLDLFPVFPKEFSQKNLQFVKGDILKGLPFENDSFDFVHMRMLLMLFSQIQLEEIVIKEIIRVCKPGGWIEIADIDVDGKSMGPAFKRLLTFSMKYLEGKGINTLISEELSDIIENTDQVEEVHTNEIYSAIGSWGGETGELATEVFASIVQDMKDLHELVGISEEEKETLTNQFIEETKRYRSYFISQRFYFQKKKFIVTDS